MCMVLLLQAKSLDHSALLEAAPGTWSAASRIVAWGFVYPGTPVTGLELDRSPRAAPDCTESRRLKDGTGDGVGLSGGPWQRQWDEAAEFWRCLGALCAREQSFRAGVAEAEHSAHRCILLEAYAVVTGLELAEEADVTRRAVVDEEAVAWTELHLWRTLLETQPLLEVRSPAPHLDEPMRPPYPLHS